MEAVLPLASSIWKFSRPHAFVGTASSVFALWLIAQAGDPFSIESIIGLILSSMVCLSAALFIVGINQYFDVAIDRVNKPFLPLASEELSRQQAWWILGIAASLAWLGMLFFNQYLIFTVVASSVLGICYSVPPLRFKSSAIMAAIMIIFVRGPIINLGLYGHFQSQISGTNQIHFIPIVVLLCVLSSLVAFCIALCKDIPDVSGDRQFGQSTFARRYGQQQVFRFVVACLSATLVGAIVSFCFIFSGWPRTVLIAVQISVLVGLFLKAAPVDPTSKPQITDFYMTIWNTFQVEYLVIAIGYFAASCIRPVS